MSGYYLLYWVDESFRQVCNRGLRIGDEFPQGDGLHAEERAARPDTRCDAMQSPGSQPVRDAGTQGRDGPTEWRSARIPCSLYP